MSTHFIPSLKPASAAIAAAFMLSACGGGGGDSVAADTIHLADAEASALAQTDAATEAEQADSSELTTDAAAGPSEQAQALKGAVSGYAKPKVAALDYSKDMSSTRAALLAKYSFVILSLPFGSDARNKAFTDDLKRRNSKIKLAHYVLMNEAKCSSPSGSYTYDITSAVNKADWWLKTASGAKTAWTGSYNNCDVNITSWAKKNSAGQTWAQWKTRRDYNEIFSTMPAVDYVHIDNFWWKPRVTADYKRNRTNQSWQDPTIQAAWRKGLVNYANTARAINSKFKVSGNHDSTMDYPEFKNQLDMVFIEGLIGKSWSKDARSWDLAMSYYRGGLRNARVQGGAIYQAFTTRTAYKTVRYGLASAMMEDGYFLQTDYPSSHQQPSWFDEFDAPIGTPIESPPTRAKQNGIWMRKYQNGVVLVNPSKSKSATISIGSGYKRLSGTQDPNVNNGKSQSQVTLAPSTGLLMVRN